MHFSMLSMVVEITEKPFTEKSPLQSPGFWIKIPCLNDCTMPFITNVTPAAMCISALLFKGMKSAAKPRHLYHSTLCENSRWD